MKRILTASAAVLALSVMSACGSQDPPGPAPTSAAPTVSPTTTNAEDAVPTMPAVASADTRAGALAFTRYFWDVVNYAQTTLDTKLLRTLGARSCRGCDGGVRWIDGIASRHGRIEGGTNRVRRVGIPSPARPGHPDWNIAVEVSSTAQVVTQPGKSPKHYAAGTNHVSMTLRMRHGSWQVEFLEYQ